LTGNVNLKGRREKEKEKEKKRRVGDISCCALAIGGKKKGYRKNERKRKERKRISHR